MKGLRMRVVTMILIILSLMGCSSEEKSVAEEIVDESKSE